MEWANDNDLPSRMEEISSVSESQCTNDDEQRNGGICVATECSSNDQKIDFSLNLNFNLSTYIEEENKQDRNSMQIIIN